MRKTLARVSVLHDGAVSPNLAAAGTHECCAFAQSARLADGRLACTYRRGETKHSYDGVLVAQTSDDEGETWSGPATVFDGTALSPPESLISAHLLACGDGSLLAAASVAVITVEGSYVFSEEGRTQARKMYKMRSSDGGQTWTPPQAFEHFDRPQLGLPGKSFVLPGGEIMLNTAYPNEAGSSVTALSFSSDHGRSFGPLTDVIGAGENRLSYDDPYYAAFPDGSVLGLFWTYRLDNEATVDVHRCVSTDAGRTWTPPRPVGMLGQVTVPLVLDDETVLATGNSRQNPEGIRLWISHDGGATFADEPPVQMWDSRAERIVVEPVQPQAAEAESKGVWEALKTFSFGLPDLAALGNGSFLLTYYATVRNIIHVRACRFRLD